MHKAGFVNWPHLCGLACEKDEVCTAHIRSLGDIFVIPQQVLEGANGYKSTDFGGHHKSFLHTSPLLYDIDSDGVREILAATFDAEVTFFDDMVLPPFSSPALVLAYVQAARVILPTIQMGALKSWLRP